MSSKVPVNFFFICAAMFLSKLVLAEKERCDKESQKGTRCRSEMPLPITLQQPADDISIDQTPIMLWWYEDPFPHSNHGQNIHNLQCSAGTCFTTNDRKLIDNPGISAFVFYGTSFLANDLPLPRNPNHIWALVHEESPKNNWIFSHENGIRIFNYTATFRRESNYPLTTQFIVDENDWVKSKYFVSTQEKNRWREKSKLAPVVYVQRDCNPPSDRDSYVEELMKYIKIDSYGPCLNNKKIPSNIDGFHKLHDVDYYHFLAKYKFHLSFENAICKDYMTEKLFRPLEIGVVPVYMGSSFAKQFMPNNHSAIFVADFNSPKELAAYLLELDNDDAKYDEYLGHHVNGIENDWLVETIKNRVWSVHSEHDRVNFIHRMYAGLECDLCDFIIRRKQKHDPKSPLPVTNARQSHIGCPEPIASLESHAHVNKSTCFWEGFHEAEALQRMLLAKETNSQTFQEKYLKIKTDKYP